MTALRKSDGSEYHCTAGKNQRCVTGRSAWAQHAWFWEEQAASGREGNVNAFSDGCGYLAFVPLKAGSLSG